MCIVKSINTETPQKHLNCPQCGAALTPGEYDEQECWTCGWPDSDSDLVDDDNDAV